MLDSRILKTMGVTIAILGTACSERATAPIVIEAPASPARSSLTSSDVLAPSSIGWQEVARGLVGSHNLSPLAAARVYAALSVAQYRAVSSAHDADTDGQLAANGIGAGGRSALEIHRGAVAGASAQVLRFFFPGAAASLEQRVEAESDATPGDVHPQFTRGLALGRGIGDAMVEQCKQDGFTTPWTGTVPTGPGMWIANGPPAGATFGGVRTYLLNTGSQFRPLPPPAFGSAAFLAALEEIRTLSVSRTSAQRASALYWNFPTGSFTPPGYWNSVAAEYVEDHGLDERAATRAFALTNAAMMDALIGCWDAKYYYWTIRPSQAEPTITLTFGLPNHPSYPSGHSCVSAAAATVLGHLFPDRATELETWLTEAGLSRMYAGIHYRFDITGGNGLGRAVAEWAIAHADRLE